MGEIVVKALVVDGENVLVVRRSEKDSQNPSTWELPGGRLEENESPADGLKREAREETGLDVSVQNPLTVSQFASPEGQKVVMIVFLAKKVSGELKPSSEHSQAKWLPLKEAKIVIHSSYADAIGAFERNFWK